MHRLTVPYMYIYGFDHLRAFPTGFPVVAFAASGGLVFEAICGLGGIIGTKVSYNGNQGMAVC